MADIVDEERYQLFRELVRALVVGTVGHDGWQAVSVVKGTDNMGAACLTCRIGAVRIVFGVFIEEIFDVCQMVLSGRGGSG